MVRLLESIETGVFTLVLVILVSSIETSMLI